MTSENASSASERRDTPLARKLQALIRRDGPISVSRYFDICLQDPEHGYYRNRPAIGAGSDFITAPEISQTFGELIGLWAAVVWQQLGAPAAFNLVEYGPGRGTLVADALRATARVPGFAAAARIRLVEVNPVLREAQRSLLASQCSRLSWHNGLAGEVEPLATIMIANELLDTQPVEQRLQVGNDTWTRAVGLDADGRLAFTAIAESGNRSPPVDAVLVETRPFHPLIARDIEAMPLVAGLFIDYGHAEAHAGDTLQAVRTHMFEHPLCSPGEADLTAQVDFAAFAEQARTAGLRVDGPVTQSAYLGALGIAQRTSRLMAANPARVGEIETGVARLLSPTGMGSRFKAIGLRSPNVAPLPGLSHFIPSSR